MGLLTNAVEGKNSMAEVETPRDKVYTVDIHICGCGQWITISVHKTEDGARRYASTLPKSDVWGIGLKSLRD